MQKAGVDVIVLEAERQLGGRCSVSAGPALEPLVLLPQSATAGGCDPAHVLLSQLGLEAVAVGSEGCKLFDAESGQAVLEEVSVAADK